VRRRREGEGSLVQLDQSGVVCANALVLLCRRRRRQRRRYCSLCCCMLAYYSLASFHHWKTGLLGAAGRSGEGERSGLYPTLLPYEGGQIDKRGDQLWMFLLNSRTLLSFKTDRGKKLPMGLFLLCALSSPDARHSSNSKEQQQQQPIFGAVVRPPSILSWLRADSAAATTEAELVGLSNNSSFFFFFAV
jgi:hypothetical protein